MSEGEGLDRLFAVFILATTANQLSLPRTSGHGGARPGAGRKPSGRRVVPHEPRAVHRARHPVHVTSGLAQGFRASARIGSYSPRSKVPLRRATSRPFAWCTSPSSPTLATADEPRPAHRCGPTDLARDPRLAPPRSPARRREATPNTRRRLQRIGDDPKVSQSRQASSSGSAAVQTTAALDEAPVFVAADGAVRRASPQPRHLPFPLRALPLAPRIRRRAYFRKHRAQDSQSSAFLPRRAML